MTANRFAARVAACVLMLAMVVSCNLPGSDAASASAPAVDAPATTVSTPTGKACKFASDCKTSCGAESECANGFCAVKKNVQGQFLEVEPASASCDDASACTVGDHCDGTGNCVGGVASKCDDGNACTDDSCDKAKGGCIHANRGADSPCDDKDAATVADKCALVDSKMLCRGTPSGDCDTDAQCDPSVLPKALCAFYVCKHVVGQAVGKCTPQEIAGRDDGNDCTVDNCASNGSQWIHEVDAAVNKTCDDGDFCTDGTTCVGVECKGGTKKVCSDDKPCTTDTCDSTLKICAHTNAECDDGKPETLDVCEATGCTHLAMKASFGCTVPGGEFGAASYDCAVAVMIGIDAKFDVTVQYTFQKFLELMNAASDKTLRLNVLAISKIDGSEYPIGGDNAWMQIGPDGAPTKQMGVDLKLLGPKKWDSDDWGIALDDLPAYVDPTKPKK